MEELTKNTTPIFIVATRKDEIEYDLNCFCYSYSKLANLWRVHSLQFISDN